ncbi:hypothetical protein R1flu_018396 [Riccia fluitans]|uniref:Uncharacterized protein n=1 Tax=Riccia fluitans TaxID=41844 RepID=A0ABD1ZFX5_9MARC
MWDIILYNAFQPWLIGDNLSNVREENRELYERIAKALLKAVSDVLEAKESAESQRTSRTDAALEQFYNTFQLFQAACDQAQEFVFGISGGGAVGQRVALKVSWNPEVVVSRESGKLNTWGSTNDLGQFYMITGKEQELCALRCCYR